MSSLITSDGLNWMLQLAFGSTTEPTPDEWEVGNDDTAPTESDTICLGRVPYTYTIAEDCDAVTGWTNFGDGGAVVLNTSGQNEGTGCLNLPISYSTGTSYWRKSGFSINLTSGNCDFYVFFYVDDKTNIISGSGGVRIYFGTGGWTNYYGYYFDKANIIDGEWNVLRIPDPTNYDQIGGSGADLSNITDLQINVHTTGSYTGDSIRMDAWHYATEAEHQKSVEAGYPVVNTTYHTVVWKVKYATNQANGYKLQRLFFKNSNLMGFNTATYAYIFKTTAKELFISTLMKIRNVT